jgi:uncharacterized membrane protein YheB (UPF0754 family)
LNPNFIQALLTVTFGAIAGGTTNAIAVWMLFHPYEPPTLFGRPIRLFQGAIPKNKERMAATIGRTVGTKLLTSEDLTRTLAEPGFREAFDDRLAAFIASLFDRRWPSLSELLPAELTNELRTILTEVASGLLGRLDEYLASEDFHGTASGWVESLAAELSDAPIGELLTPDRETAIAQAAERWIHEAVEGEGFSAAVHDYLDRGAQRLLRPGRTFQELLPIGLVASLERAIAGYLPIALERLGGLLDDPDARRKVERVLHEILNRFMRDLKFHQRLVAALIITPEMVDRVLVAIEAEGATKIAELLQDDDVRDAMARGVNNAVVDFLTKPVVSVLGSPGDEAVESAKATMAEWALSLARDQQTRTFLVEKLQATLSAAERRTWGDVFRHVPPERIADALVAGARSERAKGLYREAGARVVQLVLERPIGRLADHVPPDAPARIEKGLAPPLWSWIQEQVPAIAQRVNIARKIEEKILDYPTAQIEALIRGVTERELRLIVRLGYVLGALIGLVSATIAMAF